jgi:hypothetical protein
MKAFTNPKCTRQGARQKPGAKTLPGPTRPPDLTKVAAEKSLSILLTSKHWTGVIESTGAGRREEGSQSGN